jgi:AsmA family/AsmA-like C-terminal region
MAVRAGLLRGGGAITRSQGGNIMSKRRKIALIVLAILIVVMAGLAVMVPMLADINRYRPEVAKHLEEETGKPVEIGHLALRVLPSVAIRVDDFSMGNPPGFPRGTFVKAGRIYAVVDALALWHRQVVVKSLELDDPVLNLLQDATGRWNFENPPAPRSAQPAASGPSSFSLGVIAKLNIRNAQLAAANLLASGREGPAYFQGQGVSVELHQVNLNAFTSGSASLGAPRGLPAGGWATSLAFAAEREAQPAAEGTFFADSLLFSSLQVTSVTAQLLLFPRQVRFDNLWFKLYQGRAAGNLAFNFAGRNPSYSTNAKLSGVNVAALLAAFPQARGKMTGTLDGDFKLAGETLHSSDPLAGMRGTGQARVKNGTLPSLQLNKNLAMLARLANLGPAQGDPSSFSSLSSDFTVADNRINSKKIVILGSGVDLDAAGVLSMAGAGSLDYQGVAKLAAGASPVSGLLTGLTGATVENGKLNLPFSIGGTLDHPRFLVKPGAGQPGGLQNMLSGQGSTSGQQSPAGLVQGITGLFKKNPKP